MVKNLASSFYIIKEKSGYTVKANPYFICYGSWLIILSLIMMLSAKYASFVFINHHRSFAADVFFTVLTDLANGVILIPLAIFFFIKKDYRVLTGLLGSFLINALMINRLKHSFDRPGPLACYGKNIVETARWILLYRKDAFPAGRNCCFYCRTILV